MKFSYSTGRSLGSALRPLHWIKSGFCLAPLMFEEATPTIIDGVNLIPLLVGFSFLSSAGYLVNDIINVNEDRQHPRKKNRAIASGSVSRHQALSAAALLTSFCLLILGISYGFGAVFLAAIGYLGVSLAYNLALRDIPFVDVSVISVGFILRVGAGAWALGYSPSSWLLACTYFFCMMLGFGKRRGELALLLGKAVASGNTRGSLRRYDASLLDKVVGVMALFALTCYVGLIASKEELWLQVSVLPVIVGIGEYLRWAWRSSQVETPERLLENSSVLFGSLTSWVVCLVISHL